MKTLVLKIDPKKPQMAKIRKAARIIRREGIVAFPTETVYGLGANALNSRAVRKIFRAKRRPFDDPLIVHVCETGQAYLLVQKVDLRAKELMDNFWPGPLTLVMKKSKKVPAITTGGLGSVAIRMPNHKIACALIHESKVPIAAPSANLFGKPSPTMAQHVLVDLNGRIDAVIDGGKTRIGVESTVLDLTGKVALLLRPGGISREQIEKVIGKIRVHAQVGSIAKKGAKRDFAKSPGMAYRHYAPRAEVILVLGKGARSKIKLLTRNGKNFGVIIAGKKSGFRKGTIKIIGSNQAKIAREIYSALRGFDSAANFHIERIYVDGSALTQKGIGPAVKNRLLKAASRVIKS